MPGLLPWELHPGLWLMAGTLQQGRKPSHPSGGPAPGRVWKQQFPAQDFPAHSPGCLGLRVSYICAARSCLVLESALQSWKQSVIVNERQRPAAALPPPPQATANPLPLPRAHPAGQPHRMPRQVFAHLCGTGRPSWEASDHRACLSARPSETLPASSAGSPHSATVMTRSCQLVVNPSSVCTAMRWHQG